VRETLTTPRVNGHVDRGTERILLVEDDDAIRRGPQATLSELGYIVTAVESGVAAAARFLEGTFDAIVTDFMMPGMTGRVLVDRLAALGSTAATA
jgi:CheY-like chemotaxis protein